jgi:hypothetical protein
MEFLLGWKLYFFIVLSLPGCAHLNLDLSVGIYPIFFGQIIKAPVDEKEVRLLERLLVPPPFFVQLWK